MNFAIARLAQRYTEQVTSHPREDTGRAWQYIPSRFHQSYSDFELNEFYRTFVEKVFNNCDLIVKAPTGAGKTYLYDVLLLNALPGSTLVVLPTKALLFERSQAMHCIPYHVLHGDSSVQLCDLRYDLVFSTAEKAAELLTRRVDSPFLRRLVLAVIDEFHFILTHQKSYTIICHAAREFGVRVCGFTAMLPTKVAARLKFYFLEYRPRFAPAFEFAYFTDRNLLDLAKIHYNVAIRHIGLAVSKLRAAVFKALRKDGEEHVLIFCPTKKLAETIAEEFFLNSDNRVERRLIFENESLNRYVCRAVAFHHAGLSLSDRHDVESMFASRQLRFLACTSTLAVGVNISPTFVVVFTSMYFDYRASRIDYAQMMYMAGRSGRSLNAIPKCLLVDDAQTQRWRVQLSRNAFFADEEEICFNYNTEDFIMAVVYLTAGNYLEVSVKTLLQKLYSTPYYSCVSDEQILSIIRSIQERSGLLNIAGANVQVHYLLDRLFYFHVGYDDFIECKQEIVDRNTLALQKRDSRHLWCILHFERDFESARYLLKLLSRECNGHSDQSIYVDTAGFLFVRNAERLHSNYQIVVECRSGRICVGKFKPADYSKRRASVLVGGNFVELADISKLYIYNLNSVQDNVMLSLISPASDASCYIDAATMLR